MTFQNGFKPGANKNNLLIQTQQFPNTEESKAQQRVLKP